MLTFRPLIASNFIISMLVRLHLMPDDETDRALLEKTLEGVVVTAADSTEDSSSSAEVFVDLEVS